MNTSPPPESSSRSAAAPTRTTPETIVIGSTCWTVMTPMIADPQTPRPSCVYYCTLRTLAPAIHHTKMHVKALDARLGALPCQESWLSTRRYPVGLEPVGEVVEEGARSTSKSAVSRKFVAMTEHALGDLLAADLSGLDLVALMIDGVHFADHLCVVALGIDIDGTKHPLALVEGSTENTTLVRGLLVGLRERGLDVTRPILAVLDGAKALAAAVKEVFDKPVIARCQIHKLRNVRDHLPEKMRGPVSKRMRAALSLIH